MHELWIYLQHTIYHCTQKWQGLGSMSHLVIFYLMYTLLSYFQLEQTLCYIWWVSRHHPVCLGQPQWSHSQEQEVAHSWLEEKSNQNSMRTSWLSWEVAHLITRCVYSQCMPCAYVNDLWTDMCTLLLVGVACAFGTVSHVQQNVRRMAKHTLKRVWGSEQGFEHLNKREETIISQDGHELS